MRRATALSAALICTLAASRALADHPPRMLDAPVVRLPPDGVFPPDAAVRLELTLDATGAVTDARVIDSLRADIDAQVLDAARRIHFEPAEQNGVSVASRIRFRFRLAAPEPPAVVTPPVETPSTQAFSMPANPYPEVAEPPARAPDLELGEAVIRTRREPGAATTMTLRAEELTTVPGTFGEPTRVVATMPGVARTPFGIGVFVVRGASFENTGFFIDGFPVPALYHFGAGPAVISSRLVGELNFYPGGYPLQYGRFSAGVISLDTRPPEVTRPTLEFQLDVLKASAMAVVPFDGGRGTLAIAARRSYYELILPFFVDGVGLQYGDYQIRVDYRFTPRTRASFFAFGSYDIFDRTAAVGVGETSGENQLGFSYAFQRFIARVEHTFAGGATVSASTSFGYDDSSFVRSEPGQPNISARTIGFLVGERLVFRVPSGRGLSTSFGVDILAGAYDLDLRIPLPESIGGVPAPSFSPDILSIDGRLTQTSVAPFIEETLRLGPVELSTGVRIDQMLYGEVRQSVIDPRAVLRVKLSNAVTVMASTGFFHQQPPLPQLLPRIGNPALIPQRSLQSSLGVEANLPGHIETRVTGFYNRMYNLQRSTAAVIDSPDGPRRQVYADDGQGRAYGVEVLIRRRIERGIYGWVSYTLSRSERFVEGGTVVPFNFDQTHILNIAASWAITDRWRVGLRFQLATGSPTRRIDGAFYDSDTDRFRAQFAPRDGNSGEIERLPAYHQLDFRVDYRFRFWRGRFNAYLDVLNAYYAQNTEGWLYQYDFARRTNFPGLPILPTLGIEGTL